MEKKKNLYALLIGINEYSNPRNNLSGCVNDVQYLDEYLQSYYNNTAFNYKPIILTNQAATRANIIDGFSHFQQAQDGDFCLFHYSGHGSQCPSPEEFSHLDSDGKHETLVCHDSRSEHGRDLLDKELSYLIWKATKDKKVHFLATMDCCHSGANTRNDFMKSRRFSSPGDQTLKVEDYLGFKAYTKTENGKYTPPRGHHILLAAAQNDETAKEVYAGGEPRGIFTYCLLDVLKEFQNQISYSELMNRIQLRIRNKVKEQSPQLDATKAEQQKFFFLSNSTVKRDLTYLISYVKATKKWQLNSGALHGISQNSDQQKTILELKPNGEKVSINKVYASYSSVNGMDHFDKNTVYRARLKNKVFSNIPIAFAPGNDSNAEDNMKKAIQDFDPITFNVIENPKDSQYLIHAKHHHFFLTRLDEVVEDNYEKDINPLSSIHSVFKKVKGYELDSANAFLQALEKIVKWNRILELSNATSRISEGEIKITLSRMIPPEGENGSFKFESTDWQDPKPFAYAFHDNEWHRPAFQLKIENTGNRQLWLSLVYFSDDFGMTNILMPKHKLGPGNEVSASYASNNTTQFNIPLQMEEHYLVKGITSVREYLKLFICTDEFETNNFNQEGISFDNLESEADRGLAIKSIDIPDWITKEIAITIHRPMESKQRVIDV